jgi:hypothetical protein
MFKDERLLRIFYINLNEEYKLEIRDTRGNIIYERRMTGAEVLKLVRTIDEELKISFKDLLRK